MHLLGKRAARLVRIDDGAGGGQVVAGQVVIGDQHVDAERVGRFHAVDAGDAVVDRDQQIRLARRAARGQRDDLGRQAVAVFEAVRHQIVDLRAEHPQAAHGHGAGGGAVAVVIGDHQHAALALDRVGEQRRGVFAAFEPRRAARAARGRFRFHPAGTRRAMRTDGRAPDAGRDGSGLRRRRESRRA